MLEIPIEYLKGYTKFLNCKIDLSKKVFIPRIETEFWLKKAIKEIKIENCKLKIENLKILDIFAGSGCIGIAILKNIKNSLVNFVDIDKRAIEQIKINLKLNRIPSKRYRVLKSNLFEKLKDEKYNYIFANPPYVARERLKEVQISVKKYEPEISWHGGKRGMAIISKLLKEAKNFLRENGIIYMEFDPLQKKEIGNILKKSDYKNFKFFKDQFKKYRLVKIWN